MERKRVEKLFSPSKTWQFWIKLNSFWKPYEVVNAALRRKIWNVKMRLLESQSKPSIKRIRLKTKLRKLQAKERWVRRRIRGIVESIFK